MSLDLTFDGTLISTVGFTVHNVDKDPLEQMDRIFFDPPGFPGAKELISKFPQRIVGCNGRLVGTSYDNLVTSIIPAFSSYLNKDEYVQLKFSDESDRYFLAKFHRFRRVRKESAWRLYDIEFKCEWPFSQDTTANDNTESSATRGHTWTETNNGHTYAYPTITVTFNQSQSHFYIKNNTISGIRFDISKSFVNTDVLVLNSMTLNVGLNGSTSFAGVGDGGEDKAEFMILGKGGNEIEVGTDDGTLDCDVQVVYRKNYLS